MIEFLQTPIEYLKGVGPARGEILKSEAGIYTFGDLLDYYPFRYVDRSRVYKINELTPEAPYIQLRGTLSSFSESGSPRRKVLKARFSDDTGSVEIVWFKGIRWMQQSLVPGKSYLLFGKPTIFKGQYSFAHPELDDAETTNPGSAFHPVYSLTEKLRNRKIDSRTLRKLILELFQHHSYRMPEILPQWILDQEQLISRDLAYKWIHLPSNPLEAEAAKKRLKFEEFFTMQAGIFSARMRRKKRIGLNLNTIGNAFNRFFHEELSFELTEAQKRVMKEIRRDMNSGTQMNRLLQGDVGSGKSIIAILTALIAIDNGYQASLMAPTEILATQHFENFREALERIGVRPALLTGSTKKRHRVEILAGLEDGSIHLLIGTHALIEDPVKIRKQGVVIIDEQHRFGVAQRARLWERGQFNPHVLVMTATPIPRTLAMTLYGDLDVSRIDELPVGRKPIQTAVRTEANRLRVWGFAKEQIRAGRQVYMVYPLIEESETLDYKNLEEGYDQALHYFPRPEFQIQMLHGRMKAEDKESAMQRFKKGEIHILISTTVVEVGVNVPNATLMIIESAEKFGLAQLHQLRGRVGRGAEQSYCILMTGSKLTSVARERLKAMESTTDGFRIAELDMKLRGPGDIEGTQQSGMARLKLASIVDDAELLERSRICIELLMQHDPEFSAPAHAALRTFLHNSRLYRDWGNIS